ncbi:MAG TPA: AAA family ATPase [Thermodesulfobacteriota bacterium]|nr:AAA family ATPase [Thermodesulfobacteriota bacterium]
MYNGFYGFSEKPFDLAPDPKFLYLSPCLRNAMVVMYDGITNRKGFISFTGEVGAGKTTLIHFLLGRLDGKVKTAFISDSSVSFKDLLRNVFLELGLKAVKGNNESLLGQLNDYLEGLSEGEMLVIIIDEAQNLPNEVMEELARLDEMIPRASNRLQMIFVGQPGFEDNLNAPSLRQLQQRISIRCQTRNFTEEESREYIDYRLKLVGSSASVAFTPNAISTILIHAKGIPRAINVLCDNAFLTGHGLSRKRIDAEIIGEVINKMESPILQKSSPTKIVPALKRLDWKPLRFGFLQRRISFVILSLLCLGGLILLIHASPQPNPTKTGNIESIRKHRTGALEEVVVVEEGQTISSLSQKYYRMMNPTLLDLILDFNPEITDAALIQVNQKIKIPKITKEWMISESHDRTYKIHLGTFGSTEFAKPYKNEPALKGKKIEVFPRKVTSQDTWYRIIVGNFSSRDEAVRVIDLLKEKRLLPLFGNTPKIE